MRALTSLLLLVCTLAALAEPFGRFGYHEMPKLPDFEVSSSGFRAALPDGEWVLWGYRNATVKPVLASRYEATYAGMRQARAPSKFSASLLAPGFRAFFPAGFALRFGTIDEPLLSFEGASVAAGNPTPPDQPWVILSFQHSQPPIAMIFEEPFPELIVEGEAGDWNLRTLHPYTGWVRFALPQGHRNIRLKDPLSGRIDLGKLAESVSEMTSNLALYRVEPVEIVEQEIRTDQDSITAVYEFGRPGAVLPTPVVLAKAGGYPIEVLTGVRDSGADLLDGPTVYATERKLAVRFPLQRVPSGRALTVGPVSEELTVDVDPEDPSNVVRLAFLSLIGFRSPEVEVAAETALRIYLSDATYEQEPISGIRLPFASSGNGVELMAAYALLVQAQMLAQGEEPKPNSLFTSLAWRRDWRSGLVWMEDEADQLAASAVLAVTAAFAPKPEDRLEAAWLQAGLSASAALPLYRERRGFPQSEGREVAPLYELRYHLFQLVPRLPKVLTFVDTVSSPVRVLDRRPVYAEPLEPGRWLLRWNHAEGDPSQLSFLTSFAFEAQPHSNLTRIRAEERLGRLTLNYTPSGPGPCEAVLTFPSWADPLPPLGPMPSYR